MSCGCGEEETRRIAGLEICRLCLLTDESLRRKVAEEFRRYNIGDPLDLGPHELIHLCFDTQPSEVATQLREALEPGVLLSAPNGDMFVPQEEILTRLLVDQGPKLAQALAYSTLMVQIIHRAAAKHGSGLPMSPPHRCETIVRALRNGLDLIQTVHPIIVRNVKTNVMMQAVKKANKKAV